ncbi:MAG: hypothetical protein WC666_03185 [Candidatus Paceibacterota bacterium]|jgi:hypothetical protein
MKNITDADATKLAGLLSNIHQKVQKGQITLDQLEWFNNLSAGDLEALLNWKKPEPIVPAEPTKKFALLVDLGIITVPDDYVHEKRLTTFGEQNRNKFDYYDGDITDKNFLNPTRILKPGDKLHVRVFKQIVGGETTSKERMAFLATQKAIHTGAQGASLVFGQKRDQLPKGRWYASFDEKDRLWTDARGNHRVPGVICYPGDDFGFGLNSFESIWRTEDAFLCFSDLLDEVSMKTSVES